MDFFQEQDLARRKTGRLLILFVLAVLALVAGINVAAALAFASQGTAPHPLVFLLVTLAVLAVIGLGSLYRMASLRGGGRVVAEMLGGRRIDPGRAQGKERVLLNVVEEMAIASGAPVPAVYLLEEEQGINAFAAGFDPGDAVIGVTRGAVEQLSRDELQGVVAHEFSHVFNGDMRLNIRLMGVLHGILLLGLIGEGILRAMGRARGGRRGKGGQGIAVVLLVGVALMIFGYAGTFFGNLIKAAASRQREFLADASAVQFTRNPFGIGGALLKIAGHAGGARLEHPSARAASHFYFGEGVASQLGVMGATHPPLEERIVRILPQMKERITSALRTRGMLLQSLHGEVLGFAARSAQSGQAPEPAALQQVGNVTQAHLERARDLLAGLPAELHRAAGEPFSARAIVYGLLLDRRAPVRATQRAALEHSASADVLRELDRLAPLLDPLPVESKLPLVALAMPALAQLSADQHADFARDLETLVQADGQVTLVEVALQRTIRRQLAPTHAPAAAGRAARAQRGAHAHRVPAAAAVVLSQLARTGADDEAEASRAFAAAWQQMGLGTQSLAPVESSRGAALAEALDELARLAPYGRRSFLAAAAAAINADKNVRPEEAETFRLLAEALDVPVPPLLPDQRLA